MENPLVSVVCLCYNQASFVKEAIESVWNQSYGNIELIVVNDGSSDSSSQIIKETLKGTDTKFIDLAENVGNCKAFNIGFSKSNGQFIIDLAADDILLPARIENGINDFQENSMAYGVHFSDAFIIDADGKTLGTHYPRDKEGRIIQDVPTGNIYRDLIERYFINPPSMMVKREVLDYMNGYDEELKYEDFDFLIRSSRTYHYLFNPAPLVKKRDLKSSLGKRQISFRNPYLTSTFKVCEKVFTLNQTDEEDRALLNRIQYEMRQCVKTFNFSLLPKYLNLKSKIQRRLSSASSIDR